MICNLGVVGSNPTRGSEKSDGLKSFSLFFLFLMSVFIVCISVKLLMALLIFFLRKNRLSIPKKISNFVKIYTIDIYESANESSCHEFWRNNGVVVFS